MILESKGDGLQQMKERKRHNINILFDFSLRGAILFSDKFIPVQRDDAFGWVVYFYESGEKRKRKS